MKFKLLLITALSLIISTSLFAKPVIDSVGVKNNDGKKMILFKVKAKDTYYSIGKRYGIKPEALMKFNGKKKAVLSIGTIIEIPTEIPFKKTSKTKETAEAPKKETKKKRRKGLPGRRKKPAKKKNINIHRTTTRMKRQQRLLSNQQALSV
ncbi:hypothetical protein MgSA37_02900 [Mucilaginibacter gotjawali]|uniref:LysM domain-containing protein n=1 Tax=Mucilaginibacter gotjawali TaxID=1550579 RepID=A0A0X8X3Z9_9SPHI|nr:LysM domain-containing protein [Mucilaginibacter gotjawali]BAU54722.1 hypothetical protein MgSA37_02900 [Mucilaginibacter gotjawali]